MQATDTLLVEQSQGGNRQAFAEIVGRYQNLVCSIAFAATGSLNASEELAQEAFVAAWRSLGSLQDSHKLRPWLCGIVRNLAKNQLRKSGRDLLGNAFAIEANDVADSGDDPVESSIAREEAELLDRTLAGMPATYREPLILFYREQQSVAHVAEQLELTPSAVKQRLARGRDMLRQEVAAVIERGLLQSAPGRAFTIGVLAALPVMSGSAKAATITATTAKGVSAMSSAGIAGIAGAILGPLAGLLGGWFGYSMSMRAARSDQERAFIRRMTFTLAGVIFAFTLCIGALAFFGRQWVAQNPTALAIAATLSIVGYIIALTSITFWGNHRTAQIRRETGTIELGVDEAAAKMPKFMQQFQYPRKYESKTKLHGIPLVAVRFSGASTIGRRDVRPTIGWIAISDRRAYGILFASGNIAVGGIACGAVAIGAFSFGGLAIGALALGGAAIGWWAAGGFAIGYLAFAGFSLGWKLAMGGVAVAHELGVGGVAVAPHANTEAAKAFVESSSFLRIVSTLMSPWAWWLVVAAGLAPMLIAFKLIPPENQSADESLDTAQGNP